MLVLKIQTLILTENSKISGTIKKQIFIKEIIIKLTNFMNVIKRILQRALLNELIQIVDAIKIKFQIILKCNLTNTFLHMKH